MKNKNKLWAFVFLFFSLLAWPQGFEFDPKPVQCDIFIRNFVFVDPRIRRPLYMHELCATDEGKVLWAISDKPLSWWNFGSYTFLVDEDGYVYPLSFGQFDAGQKIREFKYGVH